MNWEMFIAIVVVNIALFGCMATLVVWSINKIDADVTTIVNRLDGHAQRIDQVYGIILQMLKDRK